MHSRLVVLIVEDHPGIMDSMERMIETWPNVDVLSASGFLDAARWIHRASRIDLLMCDVQLPGGMNGVSIAELALVTHPQLAILLFSADAASDIKGLTNRYSFIRKPFNRSDIVEHVDKAFMKLSGLQTE